MPDGQIFDKWKKAQDFLSDDDTILWRKNGWVNTKQVVAVWPTLEMTYILFWKKNYNLILSVIVISLTYEKISEKMLKMKVIQNFVVINFYIIHFIDKVCWTSQILDENSWKNVRFCCLFWCTSRRRLVFVAWSKTHNKNMSHFFKNFLQGFVKFSKLCQWNG